MDEQVKTGPTEQHQREFARTGRPRKHMGVATSDPEYLPPTGPTGHVPPSSPTLRIRANERGGSSVGGAHARSGNAGQPRQLHYDRYLQTPKKGRAIFTSQHDRQRRRVQILLTVLIVVAIALALFWFFVLR